MAGPVENSSLKRLNPPSASLSLGTNQKTSVGVKSRPFNAILALSFWCLRVQEGKALTCRGRTGLYTLDVPWNPMELEQRVGRIHR